LKIGRFDAGQRSQALRALALAEAGDAIEGRSDGEVARGGVAGVDAALPPALAEGAAAGPGRSVKIGRGRVESFGYPHRSSADLGQRWRQAAIPLRRMPQDIQSADRHAAFRAA